MSQSPLSLFQVKLHLLQEELQHKCLDQYLLQVNKMHKSNFLLCDFYIVTKITPKCGYMSFEFVLEIKGRNTFLVRPKVQIQVINKQCLVFFFK